MISCGAIPLLLSDDRISKRKGRGRGRVGREGRRYLQEGSKCRDEHERHGGVDDLHL